MDADQLNLLADLIARARAAGADAADAVLISGTSLSVQRRLGKTEHVERSEGRDLGLRVFLGQRAAIVSSTPMDPPASELAERAVAMARVVPEDPYRRPGRNRRAARAGRARPGGPDRAGDRDAGRARRGGRGGRARGAGVTNSEGAEAGYGRTEAYLVTSAGFAGSIGAHQPFGLRHRAGRRRHGDAARLRLPLDGPSRRPRRPRRRSAAARRNGPSRGSIPTRPETAKLPVVYDPRVAGGLLGHLAGAINGASVARGTSFLKDKLGQRIFAAGIEIHDDPRRVRGLRSRAVRRRGHADRGARPDRGRRADDLAAGQPFGAPARHALHRPRRARHRRPAVARRPPTSISPPAR